VKENKIISLPGIKNSENKAYYEAATSFINPNLINFNPPDSQLNKISRLS